MDRTTLICVAVIALCLVTLVLNHRRAMRQHRASLLGPPLRTAAALAREGARPELHETWYEPYLLEPAFVMRRRWRDENAAIEAEGRLFHVPGPRNGALHWDHVGSWMRHADGLSVRLRFLRIRNRSKDDRGIMSNDAVTIEFASQAEFATFLSKLPPMMTPEVVDRDPETLASLLASLPGAHQVIGTHG